MPLPLKHEKIYEHFQKCFRPLTQQKNLHKNSNACANQCAHIGCSLLHSTVRNGNITITKFAYCSFKSIDWKDSKYCKLLDMDWVIKIKHDVGTLREFALLQGWQMSHGIFHISLPRSDCVLSLVTKHWKIGVPRYLRNLGTLSNLTFLHSVISLLLRTPYCIALFTTYFYVEPTLHIATNNSEDVRGTPYTASFVSLCAMTNIYFTD